VYLIRRAKADDTPTLLKLAKMVHFINLPADKDIIGEKIARSRQCFLRAAELAAGTAPAGGDAAERNGSAPPPSGSPHGLAALIHQSDLFMFVLEDLETGGVLGTSQIISRMGGPGHPNLSLQLTRREFFSETLKQGGTHITARLHLDETGPTEIGGLILQPNLRGHPEKLGRFISLIRFQFIALHRHLFSDRIVAEMMGPVSADGHSVFWEYLGRRFINLTYEEADRFCQHSKEFMINLLPREEIYLTLLPPEARSVVGQVGPETLPARRMLEKLGFEYRDLIDPFDAGPNLEARTDDLTIVRDTRRAKLGEPCTNTDCTTFGMVGILHEDGEFYAVQTNYAEDRSGRVRLPRAAMKALAVEPGMEVGVTPLSERRKPGAKRSGVSKRGAGRARAAASQAAGDPGGEESER